jgi:pimeloyl-ACP methyl ester carboxylesterase
LEQSARFKVSVPTLVIWGMRDSALLPCLLDGLGDHVANLAVHTMADATHWVVHEKPAEVAAVVRNFISN